MITTYVQKGYKNLIVWQVAMDLVIDIYSVTAHFPSYEKYGLSSQMRRSAISIPSNIAEGSKRSTPRDFRQFVLIAYGSAAELETQLEIAFKLQYLSREDFVRIQAKIDRVMKMLHKLSASLIKQQKTPHDA